MDFTVKPNPVFLIANGVLVTGIHQVLNVSELLNSLPENPLPANWLAKIHCEVMTVQHRLSGLLRSSLPEIDRDLASEPELINTELDFQNKYNHLTGHAVKLNCYERSNDADPWIFTGSKLVYKTGLEFTTEDLLYPLLSITNVWLIDKQTQFGIEVEALPQGVSLNSEDYLMIKTGIVVVGAA